MGLTSITSHTYYWVLFFLWLALVILSGVIFPLFSSSILGTYQPGEFIFQYPSPHPPIILFVGFSRQKYQSGLPFPSPVDHVLSDISTFRRLLVQFSPVQLLSCVQLFVTPWTVAHQASLSITSS